MIQESIIYAFTAGSICLFLLVMIATPRKVNVYANYWLSVFLFSFGCIMLDRVFSGIRLYDQYPDLMAFLEVTRFAMSPALYFSVIFFTAPDRQFGRRDYLHFIPFALFLFFIVIVTSGANKSFLFSWYSQMPVTIRRGIAITVFGALKVQMVAYWILSYVQLSRHKQNIQLYASETGAISLSWLRYFLLGLVLALTLSLNDVFMIVPILASVSHFGYLFLAFYLCYFSIRQQEMYPYQPNDVGEIRDIIDERSGPTRVQRLSEHQIEAGKRKLNQVMEIEKAFLDPNLGLPQLAAKVGMSTHDLSFLINEAFGENFFRFVNRHRVEEAKILLKSDRHKHLSILGIAYESGFRSKSTFNSTFKNLTGTSPSKFKPSDDATGEKVA